MVNVLILGAGPHARRIYLPILLDYPDNSKVLVRAIVDVESQQTAVETFLKQNYEDNNIVRLFLSPFESRIKLDSLSRPVINKLNQLVEELNINSVIISTEPSAHIAYAKWALSKGLNVLMDKPISAPSLLATSDSAYKKLYSDYTSLVDLYLNKRATNPGLVFHVMSQRRYHPAFIYIRDKIVEVAKLTGTPITSFQSIHNDGQWRMPDEIVNQDYHPYNQGYGKLLHSGYHAIDIMSWLVRQSYVGHSLESIEVFSNHLYPSDFIAQIPLKNYYKFFENFQNYNKYAEQELLDKYKTYGEIDAQLSLDFKQRDGRSLTLGQFSLQHNSLGQRNWPTSEGKDLYKGNGRVRHESHYVTQGPFQTIHYQSFQSQEILDNSLDPTGFGGEYHLDIHIYRNNKMFPDWKPYEKISLKDLSINVLEGYSRGHQEDARRTAIINFIDNVVNPAESSLSNLLDHKVSVSILAAAYNSAYNKKHSLNPLVSTQKFVGKDGLNNVYE